MKKSIKKNKNKEIKDLINNKITKEINIDNNLNSKKSFSSSYSNTNINNNKNDFYDIKYSSSTRRTNNTKNSKTFRNFSNNFQNDFNIKDNDNISITPEKKVDILTNKNNLNNNKNNKKYAYDLKNHNLTNNILTFKTSDNNELITINSYSEKEKKENNNISNNNYNAVKDKKFSIIDIPAPSYKYNNNNEKDNKIINLNVNNENKNLSKEIKLSAKEKAYLQLAKSQVLPLNSQIIFSRSCDNVKKLISVKNILQNYELFLKNKIKEYENKIISYNEKITSIFTPTKIAEITLNFITNISEIEFKTIYNNLAQDKSDYDFIYYKNYIKIIYYVINEKMEDISEVALLSNLYNILFKKGYKNIKDYLYFLFISNKNTKKDNCFMINIDKIDEIINNEVPYILEFDEASKMGKFIGFSIFLIKEIIDFGNIIKNTTKLKMETTSFIVQLRDILDRFRAKIY